MLNAGDFIYPMQWQTIAEDTNDWSFKKKLWIRIDEVKVKPKEEHWGSKDNVVQYVLCVQGSPEVNVDDRLYDGGTYYYVTAITYDILEIYLHCYSGDRQVG